MASHQDLLREAKSWENGTHAPWDLQKEFYKANKELCDGFGRDRYTFTPEMRARTNNYWRNYEAPLSHGYPATAYLQMAIIYGCGLYTAREQGIVSRSAIFGRFWKHHYFDWTTFGIRSLKFGVVGGLLAGTVLFGNPHIAARRCESFYKCWFKMKPIDGRDNESNWFVKFNS